MLDFIIFFGFFAGYFYIMYLVIDSINKNTKI